MRPGRGGPTLTPLLPYRQRCRPAACPATGRPSRDPQAACLPFASLCRVAAAAAADPLRLFARPPARPTVCPARPAPQKKSTLQFKALDNVVQTVNRETGQKEALSYRCADIDK